VIHHGTVSNTTSLYLSGHVASRAESTTDCVKIIMRSLSGASVESHIRFPNTSFYWDRGYGGTDGEVNIFAVETGAHLIGTAKRMNSFPFRFDQQKVGTHQKIQMKGTMASLSVSLSVVKNCEHLYLHVHVMASLFLALKETPIVPCVASQRIECCWRHLHCRRRTVGLSSIRHSFNFFNEWNSFTTSFSRMLMKENCSFH
jgi:hypothetical protein